MALTGDQRLHPDTLAVVAGRGERAAGGPLNVPVSFASAYHPGGDATYARDDNPTWSAFEEALGGLEGGAAVAFASGMGAVTAVMELLPAGAVVVAPRDAYTGTRWYFEGAVARGRLEVRLVDITDTAAVVAGAQGASLVWLESPTNPLMGIADIATICESVRAGGAAVAVDNTFATPLLQRPLDLGADYVVHSATKFIAGHSDLLAGAVVTADSDRWEDLRVQRTVLGAVLGPMEAYLALRGLRTLPVRLARAQATAGLLAERLADHPAVTRVRYPGLPGDPGHAVAAKQMSGFGAMLSIEVADADAAERICAATNVIVHTTSLGGVETTMERRRRHAREDYTPDGLIRVSVGCEHPEDLWADLDRALAAA